MKRKRRKTRDSVFGFCNEGSCRLL